MTSRSKKQTSRQPVMRSMTGYGRAAAVAEFGQVVVECSSVNRRQLDVVVQLPRELQVLEARVREETAKKISRGRVVVSVSCLNSDGKASAEIRPEAADAAYRDLVRVKARLGLPGNITLDQVLRHPACFAAANEGPGPSKAWVALREALGSALDALLEMRAKEGAHLAGDLSGRLRALQRGFGRMKKIAAGVPRRRKAALEARIEELRLTALLDPARLASEAAILADRCDISEELSRIESHLAQFAEVLDKGGPQGRTLEFLVQELQRELNTTGSKAADADISRIVVDTKGILETIREQLSNLE